MWGRVLGLVFAGPAAYFALRGALNRPLAARLGLLLLMGGTQGLVGWWMVKSGLEVRSAAVASRRILNARITVSQRIKRCRQQDDSAQLQAQHAQRIGQARARCCSAALCRRRRRRSRSTTCRG